MKINFEIDDSSFSSSELIIEVERETNTIEFNPILQRGYCDRFYLKSEFTSIQDFVNYIGSLDRVEFIKPY